jgi:hypothetical protein
MTLKLQNRRIELVSINSFAVITAGHKMYLIASNQQVQSIAKLLTGLFQIVSCREKYGESSMLRREQE